MIDDNARLTISDPAPPRSARGKQKSVRTAVAAPPDHLWVGSASVWVPEAWPAMHPLVGHWDARHRLARARLADRLPQVLALTGPAGVGKQRLGLWLAALVFCAEQDEEPCGRCGTCRAVGGLVHPDLHWFVPIPRPKAADREKQVEEAADALNQVLEERRANSLYPPPDPIASVRLLQRRASLTPVQGSRKVFLVGDADRLVVQEASQEAANALLKLLEEPPADSLFVLTTVDARWLLPTLRSRAVPLRLGRLSDEEVAEVLRAGGRAAPSTAALHGRNALAEGSAGTRLLPTRATAS